MEALTEPGWYLVYTRPNTERRVYDELRRRNVVAYLPVKKFCQDARQSLKNDVAVPLFPNYLFVQIASSDQWSILDIQGITRYVSFGDAPVRLDCQEIGRVQELEYQMNSAKGQPEPIQLGDRVEITEGLFIGKQGVIMKMGGRKRAVVNVSCATTLIPFQWLRKQSA